MTGRAPAYNGPDTDLPRLKVRQMVHVAARADGAAATIYCEPSRASAPETDAVALHTQLRRTLDDATYRALADLITRTAQVAA